MGHFLWVFWGVNIQNKKKQAVIKITATSCWSPVCLWCVQRTKSSTCWSQATSATLSQTHTQKGWVTIYFMKDLTQYLVKIQNWGQLLNFFFILSWKCSVISDWASFKKEEIKTSYHFPSKQTQDSLSFLGPDFRAGPLIAFLCSLACFHQHFLVA